jgi:peptidoglycan/LPS O-acetylase OafA/YrhL
MPDRPMTSSSADGAARIDFMDGLRGIAAASVALYHLALVSGF